MQRYRGGVITYSIEGGRNLCPLASAMACFSLGTAMTCFCLQRDAGCSALCVAYQRRRRGKPVVPPAHTHHRLPAVRDDLRHQLQDIRMLTYPDVC
jgi:hypothetical protein